jgi:hypothetical protein
MHKTIVGAIGISLRTTVRKRARYLMVAAMTSAAGLLGIATVTLAAPPDQIYEFTVLSDTLETPSTATQTGPLAPMGHAPFQRGLRLITWQR